MGQAYVYMKISGYPPPGVTFHYSLPECISLSEDQFFVLANSKDPSEMPHDAAFHLGLHCLPKYAFGCRKYIRQALSISTASPPLRDYVQVIKCIRRVKNLVKQTSLYIRKLLDCLVIAHLL